MNLTLNISATLDAQAVGGTRTISTDGADKRLVALGANSENVLVALNVAVENIRALVLHADGGPVTIKTNAANAPDNTFTIAANSPLIFTTDTGGIPLSADISALYLSSAEIANVTIWVMLDSTP